VALGILAGIPAPAFFEAYVKDNLSVVGFCSSMVRFCVWHNKVTGLSLSSTHLVWMNNELFEWGMLNGDYGDHAFAEY
jgi:hypothetical protein